VFLVVQGLVVLLLLLTVQRHLAPATLGPVVGRWIPRLRFLTIDGESLVVGGKERVAVLLFVGPACGACHAMTPVFQQVVRENANTDVTFFGAGDELRNRKYAGELRQGIPQVPYVVLPKPRERVQEFGVRSVPYLIVLDARGVVAASGYVPSREKLEGVIESARLGLRAPPSAADRFAAAMTGAPFRSDRGRIGV
jgi:methylamine dehydrogenase accessory protein MauD